MHSDSSELTVTSIMVELRLPTQAVQLFFSLVQNPTSNSCASPEKESRPFPKNTRRAHAHFTGVRGAY
jgi:hypothetical protein